MKNKYVYFGKNSENSPMGMKIHFCAQDEEEDEQDPELKSFSKSAENFEDYALD